MDDIIYIVMSVRSISPLSLLVIFVLLPLSSSWCYKSFFPILGQASIIDISPDNEYMAITSISQNVVQVYDLSTYNLLLNYAPSSGTVASAKFTKDGTYLGIGLSNGRINLLSGQPTFNTTIINFITTTNTITDIDFNINNNKLLVCYSNTARYDIISNYTGGGLPVVSVTSPTVPDNIYRCKFSANDDIGLIDNNKRIRIYRPTNAISTTITSNANLKNFDIRPTNATPIKFIAVGNDTKGYYASDNSPASMTVNIFTPSSFLSGGSMTAACYSGDGLFYSFAGSSNDARVYLFYDNNTIFKVFNNFVDPSNYPPSTCKFTSDSSYLYVGSKDNNNLAYVYVYKKNCFECPFGYYLTSTTTCNLCSAGTNMSLCLSCTNATSCTSCIGGYYLNQTSRQCYKCDYLMQGCALCTNQVTCNECNFNYFLNSTSKQCRTCSSIVPGCLICNGTSNSTCITCSQQYYLNNGTCMRCNNTKTNCLRCSSNTTCLQCLFGFFASSGNCTSCNNNCTSCYNSAANCSTCARGFYVSSYACTPCSTYCMECNNTNYCFDCQAGTYVIANGTCSLCADPCDTCNSTGCFSCIAGYYLSNTTCNSCGSNCTSCVSSSNCSTCVFGSYLTAGNICLSCHSIFSGCISCNLTQCFSCDVSSYLNTSNICVSCVIGGCLVCNSSTSCQACAIGYYLTATFSCSACAATCQSCLGASTTCTSCIPGTYLSGNNCLYCANNCQSCNGTACFSCNIGYYLSSGSCPPCSLQIYGCTDCLNGSYCTSCQLGKYLNSSNLCSECSTNCGSCNSSTCLSCNAGYYMNSTNSCIKCMNNCSECYSASSCFSCTPGFYLNGGQCSSCWGISRGCLTCNTTFCFNCQLGYHLNSSNLCNNCQATITNCIYCFNGSSCSTCAQGYYLNAAATACTTCMSAIDGCQSCSNSTNCLTCAIGHYLNGNSCTACASKCMTCNSSGCITCAFRYSYNGSDCLTCNSLIPHCQICNNSTTCLRCLQGLYLSLGGCLSCQSALVGCSYCNSSSICTTCMSSYYLNGNVCTICSSTEGCRLCSSASNCSLCSTGYALSNTTCVICSSLLNNCIYCNNTTTCIQCSAGYYVNGLTCSKCSSVSTGCILCSNGTQCLQCEGGYYLNGLLCSACSVQGCYLCSALSSSQCINCYTGYYLSGSSCLSCNISGCIDCNQSNTCISCQLGYYLDGSSTCSLCSAISGCSKCSSSTVCTECQTLYYLSGNSCTPCSNSLVGCAFCTNSSSCLSCNSGYYLNSTSLCSLCTSLIGCLLCTDMSTCTYCNSGYYLNNSTCHTCSNISQCAQCTNATTCSACISGYALSSGTCTVISSSSGGSSSGSSAAPVKNIKLKSYYVSPTTLKHVLLAVGMTYKQISASWTTDVKLYIGSKNTSTLLTIQSVKWGKANQLIFYTNNPLNLNVKSLQLVNRLLIGQSVTVNLNSSAQISQPLLASILPNLLTDSSLTLGYSLDDPEFYNSYISAVYNTYYYVIGIVITCILFFNFLMKALCTVTHSNNHGYIIGHIFALKTVSISLYPTYGEYINYSYGYMTADLPYINKWVSELLSDSSDEAPLGYLLFYTNMSIFSVYLLPLCVYLLAVGLNYLCFNEGGSSKFKLQKNSQYLKRKEFNRFRAINQFLTNFFYFGLTFAGCASLQGSILNPYNIISLNGVGYVIGIIVYMALLGQCFHSAYNQWNFQRLRLFVKATLLSLAHFNPIYILVVVLTLDVSLFIVQAKLKYKYIVNFKLFILNQILVNFGLALIYYFPDSLLAIYISATAVSLAVIIQLIMHYLQKKIHIKDYPIFNKQEVHNIDKQLPSEEVSWKLNLQDYTLEKENSRTNFMEKDLREETHNNPLMAVNEQSQQITRSTNFKVQNIQPSPEKKDRRARRFRDANKSRNTILNASWTSFDMNSSF